MLASDSLSLHSLHEERIVGPPRIDFQPVCVYAGMVAANNDLLGIT